MSILAALAVLASCERKPEFSEVTELGCARNEAVVGIMRELNIWHGCIKVKNLYISNLCTLP